MRWETWKYVLLSVSPFTYLHLIIYQAFVNFNPRIPQIVENYLLATLQINSVDYDQILKKIKVEEYNEHALPIVRANAIFEIFVSLLYIYVCLC